MYNWYTDLHLHYISSFDQLPILMHAYVLKIHVQLTQFADETNDALHRFEAKGFTILSRKIKMHTLERELVCEKQWLVNVVMLT